MKFELGDKVKFLNEKGGGVISRIISSNMVGVTIENGFELPVITSELIPAETGGSAEKMFNKNYDIEVDLSSENQTLTNDQRIIELPAFASREAKEGIYLAFVPQDQKWLITGSLDIYLVNNTPFEALYNIYIRKNNGYLGADYGNVPPLSRILLETVSREHLDLWTEGTLQCMFHREHCAEIMQPLHRDYKVKQMKFLKEDNYTDSPLIGQKALVLMISEVSSTQQGTDDTMFRIAKPVGKPEKEKPLIAQYMIDDDTAEVDLHLHKLTEDEASLSNSQKIEVQMHHFSRCLESAISSGVSKVIFIHGVGAGILKVELHKILRAYDNVEFYDGSIAKYGVGATEVVIHSRK
jgi:hypothetical protein